MSQIPYSTIAILFSLSLTADADLKGPSLKSLNVRGDAIIAGEDKTDDIASLEVGDDLLVDRNAYVFGDAQVEGRMGVGVSEPEEKLEVGGAIVVGDTSSTKEGAIRYHTAGTSPSYDIEAFVSDGEGGAVWKSLTRTNKWSSGLDDPIAAGEGHDVYINSFTGDIFQMQSGAWLLMANLMGPEGQQGPQGPVGQDGLDGRDGEDGDSYFTQSGTDLYLSNGRLGVGTSSPIETLEVAGNVKVSGAVMLTAHQGDIPAITY